MGFYRPPKKDNPPINSKSVIKRTTLQKNTGRKTSTSVTSEVQDPSIEQKVQVYKPATHQKRAIKCLVGNKHYGLLLAPGRGKTGIVLEAFKQLKQAGKVDVLIVFAKKKIIFSTWPREIEKWGFPYEYHIAHGNEKSITGCDVILINYEGMGWLEGELYRTKLYKTKRIMCVMDESYAIQSTDSQRNTFVRSIAPLFDRRVILTGSPVNKNLIDLFAQIYFLDLGEALGQYKTHYIHNHFITKDIEIECGHKKRNNIFTVYSLMKGHDKKIFNKIKHLVMRLGESDKLPPLTIIDHLVTLNSKTKALYRELEKEFIVMIEEGIVTAANAGVLSMRLRQLCGGSLYDEYKNTVLVHTEKIEALKGIVDELQGSPCLVGYHFKSERDMIAKHFKHAEFFDAKLKPHESIKLEKRWNAGDIPLLVGQTSTIAYGLNLQESGTHLVMYTPPVSLGDYEQLIKRLHREGQRSPVTVIRLLAQGTIDHASIASLERKDKQQRNFLKLFQDHYNKKYNLKTKK